MKAWGPYLALSLSFAVIATGVAGTLLPARSEARFEVAVNLPAEEVWRKIQKADPSTGHLSAPARTLSSTVATGHHDTVTRHFELSAKGGQTTLVVTEISLLRSPWLRLGERLLQLRARQLRQDFTPLLHP